MFKQAKNTVEELMMDSFKQSLASAKENTILQTDMQIQLERLREANFFELSENIESYKTLKPFLLGALLDVESERNFTDNQEIRKVIREYQELKNDSQIKRLVENTMRALKKKQLAQNKINKNQRVDLDI